jgi:hypothetical protein
VDVGAAQGFLCVCMSMSMCLCIAHAGIAVRLNPRCACISASRTLFRCERRVHQRPLRLLPPPLPLPPIDRAKYTMDMTCLAGRH